MTISFMLVLLYDVSTILIDKQNNILYYRAKTMSNEHSYVVYFYEEKSFFMNEISICPLLLEKNSFTR